MQVCQRNTERSVTILLAEDDPGDQELTRRALQIDSLTIDLQIVEDGEETLLYLRREGRFAGHGCAPFPDLILLDLNMPRIGGREVLEAIKDDPRLSRIPVVVLTTSAQDTDIIRSYDLGCNSFIQKPVDMRQFTETVRQLGRYWFEVVTLPSTVSAAPV